MYFQTESREMPKRLRKEDRVKGMPMKPVFLPKTKASKPSDTVPKGDEVSQRFKRAVVKEMIKSGMAVKRNVPK